MSLQKISHTSLCSFDLSYRNSITFLGETVGNNNFFTEEKIQKPMLGIDFWAN